MAEIPPELRPVAGAESPPIGSQALKGLAHPLRIRLLSELNDRGRATASQLAAELGESSGATSYHLRQLHRHGFIEEDDALGSRTRGRERFWRPRRGGWSFPALELAADPATAPAVDLVLSEMVVDDQRRLAQVLAQAPSWPRAWRDRIVRREARMTLDPAQVAAMYQEFESVVQRYRVLSEKPTERARRVVVLLDVMPTGYAADGSAADNTEAEVATDATSPNGVAAANTPTSDIRGARSGARS